MPHLGDEIFHAVHRINHFDRLRVWIEAHLHWPRKILSYPASVMRWMRVCKRERERENELSENKKYYSDKRQVKYSMQLYAERYAGNCPALKTATTPPARKNGGKDVTKISLHPGNVRDQAYVHTEGEPDGKWNTTLLRPVRVHFLRHKQTL